MKALIHEQIIDGAVRPLHILEPEIFADNEKKAAASARKRFFHIPMKR